ncbi:hypothetical protein LX36DRAFT_23997 [Colletotrichum falcatum]|nr:hypothetical protein LX36DRAFT_23997 [Colletotrichum falcatum]
MSTSCIRSKRHRMSYRPAISHVRCEMCGSSPTCQQMMLLGVHNDVHRTPWTRIRHHRQAFASSMIRPCASRQTRLQPASKARREARYCMVSSISAPELRGRNAAVLFPIRELSPVDFWNPGTSTNVHPPTRVERLLGQ